MTSTIKLSAMALGFLATSAFVNPHKTKAIDKAPYSAVSLTYSVLVICFKFTCSLGHAENMLFYYY